MLNHSNDLEDILEFYHKKFDGVETLFILDDCMSTNTLHKNTNEILNYLVFSGRHHKHSVWILSQKYNAIQTGTRLNAKMITLFYCKDRDSFANCLAENNIIDDTDEKKDIFKFLKKHKHSKLILDCDQPAKYIVKI